MDLRTSEVPSPSLILHLEIKKICTNSLILSLVSTDLCSTFKDIEQGLFVEETSHQNIQYFKMN